MTHQSAKDVKLEADSDKWKARLDYTNNMVEYEACTIGITMAIEHQVKRLKVFGDSALVIYQLHREWETRNPKLIPYHSHVKAMGKQFDEILFHYVPQDEN
ncbi:hypothetical protein CR513_57189, partial [Mucuna pruriens]